MTDFFDFFFVFSISTLLVDDSPGICGPAIATVWSGGVTVWASAMTGCHAPTATQDSNARRALALRAANETLLRLALNRSAESGWPYIVLSSSPPPGAFLLMACRACAPKRILDEPFSRLILSISHHCAAASLKMFPLVCSIANRAGENQRITPAIRLHIAAGRTIFDGAALQ
ncbi:MULTISPECIES: hypothetical protein [Novosphingobium]|uniref:hypothetical protein n=1 Tax=Novosphingobium TaxID=165696 RepID=UPI0012DD537E|nr:MULTISPECIES: hypothetical protein [Novosphingobium]MBF7013445.1 hypothetical protein [Novosphingobium sp. HR1a]